MIREFSRFHERRGCFNRLLRKFVPASFPVFLPVRMLKTPDNRRRGRAGKFSRLIAATPKRGPTALARL